MSTDAAMTDYYSLSDGSSSSSARTPPATPSLTRSSGLSNSVASQLSLYVVDRMGDVCSRRLRKLETFEGDENLGYPKPSADAVAAIRSLLMHLYTLDPTLESPAISPSQDGEVLVSWRRQGQYFVCHFDTGRTFEWVLKAGKLLSGYADSGDRDAQNGLARLLTFFLEPSALESLAPASGSASNLGTIRTAQPRNLLAARI